MISKISAKEFQLKSIDKLLFLFSSTRLDQSQMFHVFYKGARPRLTCLHVSIKDEWEHVGMRWITKKILYDDFDIRLHSLTISGATESFNIKYNCPPMRSSVTLFQDYLFPASIFLAANRKRHLSIYGLWGLFIT